MTRKQLLLLALLGILALALGYAYRGSPKQERVASVSGFKAKSTPVRESRTNTAITDQRRVRLDILERGIEAFSEPQRDIFRLTQRRSLLAAPPPPPVPPPAVVTAPPPPVALRPAAPAVSLPRFNVLGLLQKEGERTVFLSLNGDIFIVKAGERFGAHQEFVAEKMTNEQLVVRQEGLAVPVTLSLAEITSDTIATSFKRSTSTTASSGIGPAPVRRQRGMPAAVEEVAGEADASEPEVQEPKDAAHEENAPAEAAAAEEKTNGNMSSLQLRSIFQ